MFDTAFKQDFLNLINDASTSVYFLDKIDSTNNFAATVPASRAIVVADEQTCGKGRLNRTFFSPAGCGIYMSLKIPFPDVYSQIPFITTLAAVAVHRCVYELFGIDCGIKWVNDIYKDGKKLCGILCRVHDDCHAIIGIGLNFYPSALPDNLKSSATHLADRSSPVTRGMLAARICNAVFDLVSNLPDTSFIDYYRAHSCVLGKSILCIRGNSTFPATALDIDNFGGLVVSTASGVQTLTSGEISIRFTD